MSDLNLLVCGCAVSFIAVGGAYVYLREAFERAERSPEAPEGTEQKKRDSIRAA